MMRAMRAGLGVTVFVTGLLSGASSAWGRGARLGGARGPQLRRAHQHDVGRGRALVRRRRHDGVLQRPRGHGGGAGRSEGPLYRHLRRGDGQLEPAGEHGDPRERSAGDRRRSLRLGDDREPWITATATPLLQVGPARHLEPSHANDLFVTHKVNGRVDHAGAAAGPHQHGRGERALPGHPAGRAHAVLRVDATGRLRWIRHLVLPPGRRRQWQEPVNQGPNINTAAEEFHFSQDEDGTVYFTSSRPGGFGGMDIWGATPTGENSWGPAVNLGPRVNTSGADMCPALPPGGTAFSWFSNRSDNSLGSIDIYWTTKAGLATGALVASWSARRRSPVRSPVV